MWVWVSPAARNCSSAALAAALPPPRLDHRRRAAELSDAVIALWRLDCCAPWPPAAMTAIATGTFAVDQATAERRFPTRSTLRPRPSPDTATPEVPPRDAASRSKL